MTPSMLAKTVGIGLVVFAVGCNKAPTAPSDSLGDAVPSGPLAAIDSNTCSQTPEGLIRGFFRRGPGLQSHGWVKGSAGETQSYRFYLISGPTFETVEELGALNYTVRTNNAATLTCWDYATHMNILDVNTGQPFDIYSVEDVYWRAILVALNGPEPNPALDQVLDKSYVYVKP